MVQIGLPRALRAAIAGPNLEKALALSMECPPPTGGPATPAPLLHVAAWMGEQALVDAMIQASWPVSQATQAGATALHYARSPGVAQALLDAGANVMALDDNGALPVETAMLAKPTQVRHVDKERLVTRMAQKMPVGLDAYPEKAAQSVGNAIFAAIADDSSGASKCFGSLWRLTRRSATLTAGERWHGLNVFQHAAACGNQHVLGRLLTSRCAPDPAASYGGISGLTTAFLMLVCKTNTADDRLGPITAWLGKCGMPMPPEHVIMAAAASQIDAAAETTPRQDLAVLPAHKVFRLPHPDAWTQDMAQASAALFCAFGRLLAIGSDQESVQARIGRAFNPGLHGDCLAWSHPPTDRRAPVSPLWQEGSCGTWRPDWQCRSIARWCPHGGLRMRRCASS